MISAGTVGSGRYFYITVKDPRPEGLRRCFPYIREKLSDRPEFLIFLGKENPKPMLVEKSAGKNGVYCI